MAKRSMCVARVGYLGVMALSGLGSGVAVAWGPHQTITQVALGALPDRERWEAALGPTNLTALGNYCLLPDQRGKDLGSFYADDYLLIRGMPIHVGHTMPAVREAFAPYFRRALQALRTETPENACRQLGPLVHFVEDVGAPPHAKAKCPYHTELENWVKADQILIGDYEPRLLGHGDDEALAGMMRRIDGLVEFSKERAERALPLVKGANPDREKVEPIILESALESARVTADVLHTVLTLGLGKQPEGARLTGAVTAAEFPGRNDHGARVVLLDTAYATLATSAAAVGPGWRGEYQFRGLPPGEYRVLAYRTGSEFKIQGPIRLGQGRGTVLDFELKSAEPAGNILENPDGRLSYLEPGAPDRWKLAKGEWTSTAAVVQPGVRYRCGASLKDPAARVRFEFAARPAKDGKAPEPQRVPLEFGGQSRGELIATAGPGRITVAAVIESARPLAEALGRAWVVAEPAPSR